MARSSARSIQAIIPVPLEPSPRESGWAIPAVYNGQHLLGPFRLLEKKNVNFAISDLGFPEELGHTLGWFGVVLPIYGLGSSLVFYMEKIAKSRSGWYVPDFMWLRLYSAESRTLCECHIIFSLPCEVMRELYVVYIVRICGP